LVFFSGFTQLGLFQEGGTKGLVCFKFHPTNYIKTWSLGYLGSPKAPFLLSFFGFLPFVFAFSLALLLS